MNFQKVVVLGTGTLPLSCALAIRNFSVPVSIFDMDEHSGLLKRRAAAEGIPYEHTEAQTLFRKLSKISVPTLLISAINPFLLPKYLLANPFLFAVNCHQALLPRHPGRNAEMWAIYEGDSETGITWHILTNEVDAGDILIQKSFPLTRSHTSYQVFREQIQLAEQAFQELLPHLLDGTFHSVPQPALPVRSLHYSWEVPNEGILNPDWSADKISAFLRAMDYSILQVVPRPKMIIKESTFLWKKYRLLEEQRFPEGIHFTDSSLFIQKQTLLIELCHYKKEDFTS
jgi:methionyl-tRNA formyltransferase